MGLINTSYVIYKERERESVEHTGRNGEGERR